MAKLFGIHELELLDGVSPEEFESFISSAYNPTLTAEDMPFGVTLRVVKEDQGKRNDKYAIIIEIPSVEMRNAIAGSPPNESGGETEEAKKFMGHIAEMDNRLMELAKTVGYTDYYEL